MAASDGPSTSRTLLRDLWNPENNEEAWGRFLVRYGPLIYGWCRRSGLQHADAEDVRATVLAKLAQALRDFEYDPAQRFRGWLKTVVDNAVRSFWRQRLRQPGGRGSGDTDVHKALEQTSDPADVDGLVQELDGLLEKDLELAYQAVARVQERVMTHTWQAYWLTAIEEQSAGEVAAKLGMTTAAVYVAKNRIANMLRAEGEKLHAQALSCAEVGS